MATFPYTNGAVSVANFRIDDLMTFSLGEADPCRYRFLDVQRFLGEEGWLTVTAFSELPTRPYAAISYVWRGLESTELEEPAFNVEGLDTQPSVPIDTLRTICIAASKSKCTLLWLDKLCIRQDSELSKDGKRDNEWQVQHMHKIYGSCSTCLVLPGGLNRLAALDEKTTWIERAWTLQEALAPPDVRIVCEWKSGDAILQHNAPVFVDQVVPRKAAVIELKSLLGASLKSEVKVIPRNSSEKIPEFSTLPAQRLGILGSGDAERHLLMALLGALDHKEDNDARLNAIWRCTLLRSAKFAVDMIYSIMGLMDTILAVDYGKDPTEVVVDFTRALTDKGQRADWLGIAPGLGPSIRMSAMPVIPFSSDNLGAFIEVAPRKLAAVKQLLTESNEMMWWWLEHAPRGKVGIDGSITFTARAKAITKSDLNLKQLRALFAEQPLQRDHPDTIVQCSKDRGWTFASSGQASHFAVVIGRKKWYTSGIFGCYVDPNTTLLMIVEDREQGPWRNIGYAWADEGVGKDWSEREFRVGG